MAMEKVAVIGAGFMGAGIAQVAAQSGLSVTLVDTSQEALTRAKATMNHSLARFSEKGHIQESADAVMARVVFTHDFETLADIAFVFESVFERIETKHEVLQKLEDICGETAIFATNTSTIPITELAAGITHKSRLVGVHFFSPVPMNPLLEIIPSQFTGSATLEAARNMGTRLGKHPLFVKKDIAGFLMNRMYAALAHEAIGLVACGAGTVEDVDRGMQLGYGMAIGPLTIADLVGLDVCLHVMENLGRFDPDWRLPLSPLLQEMVAGGRLGRKSGKGFYLYDERGKAQGVAPEFCPQT